MGLLSKVEQTVRDENLIQPGDTVVAAVSGGPDSMALLHLLTEMAERIGFRVTVAHVNHGFRPKESEAEARTVADYAAVLGVPCDIGVLDLPLYIAQTGKNPQAAAREKRYGFLHEIAERRQAAKIALAHHADDQAETVLMRLLRGAGPSGLTGMALRRTEKKVELIRPLLRIYKSEIERHCEVSGIPVCRDSSNEQRKYARNAIRLDAMPMLRHYNDKLPEALNRLADTMRDEDEWMAQQTRRAFEEIATVSAGARGTECRLGAQVFAGLPVALQRRLIKLILEYVFAEDDGFDYARIEAARAIMTRQAKGTAALDMHGRVKLVREYDDIAFFQLPASQLSYTYALRQPGESVALPEIGVELVSEVVRKPEMYGVYGGAATESAQQSEACFDCEHVRFPLEIRSRLPGDRMEVLGLKGTKKVKDMFVDGKVPAAARDRVPIVLDASGRILWIPGVRRSAYALVDEPTKDVLVLRVRMPGCERLPSMLPFMRS